MKTWNIHRAGMLGLVIPLISCAMFGVVSAAHATEIKIGVVQVLTGPNSKFGGQTFKGIKLAAEQINQSGGVKGVGPIKLVVEDSAGEKEQAVNAFRRLIAQEHVAMIIGPTLSSEALAAAPVACQRDIPMLTVNATAKGIPDICPFVFRTSLAERQLLPLSLSKAKEKYKIKRAAIFYANDDPNMVESFSIYKEAAAKLGIEIVDIESFATKDTDFSAQLTKVKALNIDAILTGAYPDTGASILTQAAKLGLPKNLVYVGGNGFNSPTLITLAGLSAEGVIVSSPWYVGKLDADNVAFIKSYRLKYQQDPDTYAAQGYQGMMLVAAALAAAPNRSSIALRDTLAHIRITGLFGNFQFSPNRDPAGVGDAVTLQVKDGVFKPI